MTRAHIVNERGQRLGRAELEARIAAALDEAQRVLSPGILSSLVEDLVARHTRQTTRRAS
jgi:hypothetical protein